MGSFEQNGILLRSFHDYRDSVTLSSGKVEWDVNGETETVLDTPQHPHTMIAINALSSDVTYKVEVTGEDPSQTPTWRTQKTGTVATGDGVTTILREPAEGKYLRLDLDSSGHEVEILQTESPVGGRYLRQLASGSSSMLDEAEARLGDESEAPEKDPANHDSGLRGTLAGITVFLRDVIQGAVGGDQVRTDIENWNAAALPIDPGTHAGTQSVSGLADASSQDINPSSNGVSGDHCEIHVQNVGSQTVWVNGGSDSAVGRKLKPGVSTTYADHTSTDGDLQIRNESGDSADVEVDFRE